MMKEYYVMIREFETLEDGSKFITNERYRWVNGLKEARGISPVPLHYSRNMGNWWGVRWYDIIKGSGIECMAIER